METLKSTIDEFFSRETMLRTVDYFIARYQETDRIDLGGYFIEGNPRFEKKNAYIRHPLLVKLMDTVEVGLFETEDLISDVTNKEEDYKIVARINVACDEQYEQVIQIISPYVTSWWIEKLNQYEDFLKPVCIGDYLPLYYLSVVFHEGEIQSIRVYFKTFGVDEDNICSGLLAETEKLAACDSDHIQIQAYKAFEAAGAGHLRCIGLQFDVCTQRDRTKYYFKPSLGNSEFFDVLDKYSVFAGTNKKNHAWIRSLFSEERRLRLDLIQMNPGCEGTSSYVKYYFKPAEIPKEDYFSMKAGLVVRNVGGVYFLIDIHEKDYYNLKILYRLNEIGQEIVKYGISRGVFTIDSLVCNLKRRIVAYQPEMYGQIYTDCKEFISELQKMGYVERMA